MTRISNYEELRLEKNRLQQQLILQKAQIRDELNTIKERLEPLFYVASLLGIFQSKTSKGSILKMGAKAGVEILAHQTLVSKAGWLTKLVVPFMLKGVTSGLIDKIKNRKLFKS